jgi:hypothetical protein
LENQEDTVLHRAEVYRELGLFDESEMTLQSYKPKKENEADAKKWSHRESYLENLKSENNYDLKLLKQIRQKNSAKNSDVFVLWGDGGTVEDSSWKSPNLKIIVSKTNKPQ